MRDFGSYGERPRKEALCPVCGALERHRLATIFLRSNSDLLCHLHHVLHVAPEAPMTRILRNSTMDTYVSVDLSSQGAMVQADLTRMPFPSQSFDAIYCSHVLEHVPEDQRALAELNRVLRPGGWALIQVPIKGDVTVEDPTITNPDVRRRLFGQPDHVRIYGQDFGDRLAEARFSVSVERPQQGFDEDMVSRCGLRAAEDIFLCKKAH